MNAAALSPLFSCGYALEMDEHSWVELTDSSPLRNDMPDLRQRMTDEGRLFFRGFFPAT